MEIMAHSRLAPPRHVGSRLLSILFLALAIKMTPSAFSQPFRRVLTSSERGIHENSWKLTPRDLKLRSKEIWSVRKLTLHGGKQEGVDVIILNNGRLSITVVPTRGMSIARVDLGDVRLGWDSAA